MTILLRNYISNKLYSSAFKGIPIEHLDEVRYKLKKIKEAAEASFPWSELEFKYRIVYRGPRNIRTKMPWDTSKVNYWEDWTRKKNAIAFDVYITPSNNDLYSQTISYILKRSNEIEYNESAKDSLGNILKHGDIVAFFNGTSDGEGQLSLGKIYGVINFKSTGRQFIRIIDTEGKNYLKQSVDVIAGKQ